MAFTLVLGSIISFLLTILYYLKHKQNHWKYHNIPYVQPKFPGGSFSGMGQKFNIAQLLDKHYKQLKGKGQFGGLYFFSRPIIIALDLEFVKNVLVKDFNYFQSRGLYYNEKDDPLTAHLVNIEGQKWRHLRAKLTPTFTSGKMKFMFPTMLQAARELEEFIYCEISQEKVDELNMKEIMARFTTDVIGTCAFGIECNSLKDPDAQFRLMGKQVFERPRNSLFKRTCMASSHKLSRFFGLKLISDNVSEFFLNIVKETVEYREANNVKRNDFMDLLIQLKNQGHLEEGINDEDNGKQLTIKEIAAQAFVFFLAGFETSSTLLSFCLLELSLNETIQDKLRREIESVLKKYDGKVTYEAVKEMHYMEQILCESLRKYPPIGSLPRRATMDYNVPGVKYTIAKGQSVLIPIFAIHRDADYYPDPEKFDPERFCAKQIKERHPLAFIPFGDGPRNCIGLRFGMMQAKIGLLTIVKNFKFIPSSRTKFPIEYTTKSNFLSIRDGLWLKMTPVIHTEYLNCIL